MKGALAMPLIRRPSAHLIFGLLMVTAIIFVISAFFLVVVALVFRTAPLAVPLVALGIALAACAVGGVLIATDKV